LAQAKSGNDVVLVYNTESNYYKNFLWQGCHLKQ